MQKFLLHFKPIYGVIIINLIGFFLLYFYKEPYEKWTIFFGLLLIAALCLTYFLVRFSKMGDEYLFIISSMLVSLGVIMLYRLDRELATKQIMWLAGGILLFLLSYYLYNRFNFWSKLIYFYLALSFVIYILTFLLGSSINGANNWIRIGGFSIQPSEIIKVLFIFFIASYHIKPDSLQIKDWHLGGKKINIDSKIIFSIITFIYLGFLILQREWGSALLFFAVYFVFLYVLGFKPLLLIINSAIAVSGAYLGYTFLEHIRVRVDIWINPWKDVASKGYQITQSLFAIAAGGFFGTGIGMGRPDFIPEVHTDFIFSAICEEMGIFGGIAVILLFFIFIYRGFKISLEVKEPFEKVVSLGLTLLFGFQTFVILGGVTKFIPLTGITLPFISYGGSSLITSFISLGLLQAISKRSEV